MTREQFEGEKNYRAALAVAKTMLKQGIINEKDFCRIDTMLLDIYQPILGKLCRKYDPVMS